MWGNELIYPLWVKCTNSAKSKTIRIVMPTVKGGHGNLTRYSSISKTMWMETEKWRAVESPDLCCPRCHPSDKVSGYNAERLAYGAEAM